MLLQIHPQNPSDRHITQVVNCLRDGGVIIYPTDTVYGIGCDILNAKAVEKLCNIRQIKPEKSQFSFVCYNLKHISDYTLPFDKHIYKLMNRNLPGAFTFILNASNTVPRTLRLKRKSVGIRVPDNKIALAIVEQLGNPIMSASLKYPDDDLLQYPTNPEEIYEQYGSLVDIVIDGGMGGNMPSTVVDCTGNDYQILRQGIGELIE